MQFHGLTRLLRVTTKPEDMLDQIPASVPRSEHFLQIVPDVTLHRSIEEAEFRIPQDSPQNVVEIMRNPAGQRANGLHLLRLAQARFEPPPLRDIMDDRQNARF